MRRRVAGLDLIRGVAIGLVLLRHAWPDTFGSGGIVGVVAFFALSGYLITGLLVRDISTVGRVRYGRFYRNRALRLLPPLLLMLLVLALVTVIADPLGEIRGLPRALLIGVTYTGNLPVDLGSSAIDHLWTLATEEQFYLIWPLLLTLALRKRITGRVIAAAAALLVVVLIITIALTFPEVHRIYRLPTSWSLAMVIGAAASIWRTRISALLASRLGPSGALGSVAAVALVALSFLPDGKENPLSYLVLGPVVAALTVVLIFSWSAWRELPTRWLAPLLSLGTISYAAYLWDYPLVLWFGVWFSGPWVPMATIAATVVAASVSWWLVEVPAHRWRDRMDARTSAGAGEPAVPS